MHVKYLSQTGEEISSTELKFMPRKGESVDLGDEGIYTVTDVVRHTPLQEASVYLSE